MKTAYYGKYRYTDNDKSFGPFIFFKTSGNISIVLKGKIGHPQLFFCFGKYGMIIILPHFVSKIGASARYGVSLSNLGGGYDFFQLYYGSESNDSGYNKQWCCHLPWTQWKHIRSSIYNPDGSHFATMEKGKWEEFHKKENNCGKSVFLAEDFDGEKVIATCMIEEAEWSFGTGWFSWLRVFRRNKIRKCLDIKFHTEVGPEKGSWKGGTLGHGIEMKKGETPYDSFKRYCETNENGRRKKEKLKFIGIYTV